MRAVLAFSAVLTLAGNGTASLAEPPVLPSHVTLTNAKAGGSGSSLLAEGDRSPELLAAIAAGEATKVLALSGEAADYLSALIAVDKWPTVMAHPVPAQSRFVIEGGRVSLAYANVDGGFGVISLGSEEAALIPRQDLPVLESQPPSCDCDREAPFRQVLAGAR